MTATLWFLIGFFVVALVASALQLRDANSPPTGLLEDTFFARDKGRNLFV